MKKLFLLLLLLLSLGGRAAHCQCPEALMRYAERYPAAESQDLYKLVFQDLYGPGHLLTDSLACIQYLTTEVTQMHDTLLFPLTEYTLCDSNFVRVNLLLVKRGYLTVAQMTSVLRSARGLPTPDSRFVMTHSNRFKAAYDPHYRIVNRHIFELEIRPAVEAFLRDNGMLNK